MGDNSDNDDKGIQFNINQKFKNTAAFFRTAAKFQAVPFTWTSSSSGQNRLISLPELQLIWWYIISFSIIPFDIFLWVDLYYQFRKYVASSQFVPLTMHILYSIGWLTIVCMRLDYFLKRKSKVQAFNKLLKFMEESIHRDSTNTVGYIRHLDKFDKLMAFGLPAALAGPGCFAILVMIFPEHRNHWWYLVIPAEECHVLVKILFCGVEFIQMVYPWIAFVGNVHVMTFYIACLDNILGVLNIEQKEKLQHSTPADVLKLQKMYRSVHILTTMYNQAFGGAFGFPAMKFTCTLSTIVQFSIIILMARKFNPILTIGLVEGTTTLLSVIACVLPFAGNIHEKSKLINPKYQPRRGIEFKILRSCKPLAINIGSLYRIKKITTLSYFSLYLVNFGNILIALKEFAL